MEEIKFAKGSVPVRVAARICVGWRESVSSQVCFVLQS